ncbi:MAG: nickel-dependent lactate racemase [Deltaproteobacteria bacterium]|nr:nickel-dependent lactate racemase [Deltaproteobacteria bacterium]
MEVRMNYGRGTRVVSLPEDWEVSLIAKRPMALLEDPVRSLREALAAPVAAPPLALAAREARACCILICDITRPVPNGLILPELLRTLLAAGMSPEAITILVATGLHRPNLGAELEELVGDPWVMSTVRVENHYARDEDAHVALGRTKRGTEVLLDRRFVQADLRIAIGLVEPHFMAGYSGGRKVIAPGVAHARTITTFHTSKFNSHPNSANCVLQGNPLHEEQLEIVGMLGGALAVNVVIDEHRRPAFLNFGEVVASHLQAVDFIRGYAEVPVAEQFHTVLTSAAGYPLDKTYYQTVKGMVGAMDILAPGGDLVIVSECSEGMGSKEYKEAQVRLREQGPQGFMAGLQGKSHAAVDEWQTEMQLKPMSRGQVHLFTEGLKDGTRDLTGVNLVASPESALRASVARSGIKRVAVIPEGPYVVPVYRPGS